MPCRNKQYALKDQQGQTYPLMIDQYCRNHVMLPFDVCLLPALRNAVVDGVDALRIEGQYYEPAHLKNIVRLYRREIDRIARGKDVPAPSESDCEELIEKSPRPFGMGAYAKGVLESLSHLKEEELSCTSTR
jgi:putative protease